MKFLQTVLFVLWLLSAATGLADDIPLPRDESGVPLIKEWIRKINTSNVENEQVLKIQGRVLFIEKWVDSRPQLVELNVKKFNDMSMFKVLSASELAFAMSINGLGGSSGKSSAKDAPPSKKSKQKNADEKSEKSLSKSEFYEAVSRILDVVMIVEKDSKKPGYVKIVDSRRKRIIYKGTEPKSYDPLPLYNWLSRILGYHGVVVDSSGDFVLVSAAAGILSPDINSLILKDSAEKTVIRPSDRLGLGLLKLERWAGKYGLFRFVINEGEVPIGSKVIIEVKSAKNSGTSRENPKIEKTPEQNGVESEEDSE